MKMEQGVAGAPPPYLVVQNLYISTARKVMQIKWDCYKSAPIS